MAGTYVNTRPYTFKRRGLIEQGKVLLPTRMIISYRFKTTDFDETNYPEPIVEGWGIVKHDTITPTYCPPVLLNKNQSGGEGTDVLMDSADPTLIPHPGTPPVYNYDGYFLECSQEIRFNREYFITAFGCKIKGIEHLDIVREIILFGRYDETSEEEALRVV